MITCWMILLPAFPFLGPCLIQPEKWVLAMHIPPQAATIFHPLMAATMSLKVVKLISEHF